MLKHKFPSTLKNAQRILERLKHTHRMHIGEVEEQPTSQRQPVNSHHSANQNSENTFEQQEAELASARDKQATLNSKASNHDSGTRRKTGASPIQRLELQYLKNTFQEYQKHLETLEANDENLLLAIDKMTEKLNSFKDFDQVFAKYSKRNALLDAQIKELEAEQRHLDWLLFREQITTMKEAEDTKKHIRSLVNSISCDQNEVYQAFAAKWNQYLHQVRCTPRATGLSKQVATEQIKQLVKSFVHPPATVQAVTSMTEQPPKLQRKTNSKREDLLGNLKQFSKSLKLPIQKLKKT